MPDNLTPPGFNFDDILNANTSTGDPVLDEMTWESMGVDINHPAANIPMPGEDPAPLPPKGSIAGPKVSVGSRGMTDEGIKRAKGVFGEADARVADRTAGMGALADAQMAQSRENFSKVGEAFDLAIQKTQEFQTREQELQGQVVGFNQQAAELEQRMAAQAQAEKAAYVAQYKEQLALVRQLSLQSGNPMSQLSKGEAIGLAGAQFAQGFLAAQGVNIDVSGQVDRWVERSINEHQMKIQNLRTAAQDTMHMYEIARQNSADEWEARQRYRGFVIAGLQASIQLNASRFQSDIAIARATEQIARLQVEADSTERSIADAHFARVNQIYQSEYDRAYKMGSLSIEQKRLSLENAKHSWDMDPRNPKNMPKPGDLPLAPEEFTDPEGLTNPDGTPLVDPTTGNRAFAKRWRVKSGLSEKRQAEVAKEAGERVGDYAEFLTASETLQKSYLEAKAIRDQLPSWQKANWEVAARADATGTVERFLQDRRNWTAAKVKVVSGAAATDKERAYHEANAYVDKVLSRDAGGKGEKLYANLIEGTRSTFEARMNALPLESAGEGRMEWRPPASPRTRARNLAARDGLDPEAGLDEKLLGRLNARDAKSIDRTIDDVSGAWADFKQIDHKGIKTAGASAKEYAQSLGQPEWGVALETLAYAVAAPHRLHKQAEQHGVKVRGAAGEAVNDDSPADIRKEAYIAISKVARGEQEAPVEAMEWAGYLKDQIDNDPKLSAALEGDEDVLDSPFVERLRARPGRK